MEYTVVGRNGYPAVEISLEQGEHLTAEQGAMAGMTGIRITPRLKGGFGAALKRSLFGRETMFLNELTAFSSRAEVLLAPVMPGDVTAVPLDGKSVYIQAGAFLASAGNIQITTHFVGMKGFFSSEGMFFLKASGRGIVFVSAFGALLERHIEPESPYSVDAGHLVLVEEGLKWNIRAAGGIKALALSGEILVSNLSGKGMILMQTRNLQGFVNWLTVRQKRQMGERGY
jgi:uncharacterized protein (TIGR00266 family)